MNYSNFKSDHLKRFNAYIAGNMADILAFENKAISTFKEMDSVEELNTFFEIEKEQVLNDCDFYILNFQDFKAFEQDEKVGEILDRAQQIIITDQKNIEIDFKAMDNLNKIKDFYDGLEPEKTDILKVFSEKEQSLCNGINYGDFKDLFFRAENLLIKLMKCQQKIRRTQLTITIEDIVLSDNVENFNKEFLLIEDIVAIYNACDAFYSKIVEDFDELLQSDLSKPDKDADERIIYTVKLFYTFLNEKNNKLEQFFTLCYVFRDRLSETVMDDTSVFLSLLLKKISALKALSMIDYYGTTLKPLITRNIGECKKLIQQVFEVPNIEEAFNTLGSLNFGLKNVLEFLKMNLGNKKTTPDILNTDYLNKRLDEVLQELKEFSLEIDQFSQEIAILEVILQNFEEYRAATTELKSINVDNASNETNVRNQLLMRKFQSEQARMHRVVEDFKGFGSEAYTKFIDIIDGNQTIADEFKDVLLKIR